MTEETQKHLEFIQNVVTRMNNNSFQIKGWNITLVSAIFAIYATNQNPYFVLVSVFPTMMFWFLDAYYLSQERKFRGLYEDIAGLASNPNRQLKPFEMRPDLYTGEDYDYWPAFKSKTVSGLYLSLVIILMAIFIILKLAGK